MNKPHRNALQPGHLLHWYRIKAILGQGGFGITYLAHDVNLDEDVAIKEYLPPDLAVREDDCSVNPLSGDHGVRYRSGLIKFINEARTLGRFRHPGIVRVRSVFEANNTAYMVMEYEEGETLKDLLARRRTLGESELMSLLLPILDGLHRVHSAGFIHRDVKPANIFIRSDGSPLLLDFGSARQALGQDARTLTTLVSPGYAPFEQYCTASSAQGPWSDIYGLGATLYRAVSGRAPMDAIDRSEALLRSARNGFISARELGSGCYSDRFLRAIDHALSFDAGKRPQSVAEWRAELFPTACTTQPPADTTTLRLDTAAMGPATIADAPAPRRAPRRAWVMAAALFLLLNFGLNWHAARDRLMEPAAGRATVGAPIVIVIDGGDARAVQEILSRVGAYRTASLRVGS